MKKNYQAKGKITFFISNGDIAFFIEERPPHISDRDWSERQKKFLNYEIFDLISGEDFLKQVKANSFNDYDGRIAEIFVDGYISNLGLVEEGICQGKFLVDGETFKSICDLQKVEVNWVNK